MKSVAAVSILLASVSVVCANSRRTPDYCILKAETGPCKASFQKWYYEAKTGFCRTFTWGGCAGNSNRFDTKEQCLQSCRPTKWRAPRYCQEDAVTGLCKALFLRWYHEKKTGTCRMFTWGGCGGNENKFGTEEECLRTCQPQGRRERTCSLRRKPGPCKAAFPRWFFDQGLGHCVEFIYGGCRGNRNNFETCEQCMTTCTNNKAREFCRDLRKNKLGNTAPGAYPPK